MPALVGLRALPWRLILEVATIVVTRFRDDLQPGDRRRLTALVRKSKGNPRRLTEKERHEVVKILRRVDLSRLGRDVAGVVTVRGARRRLKR